MECQILSGPMWPPVVCVCVRVTAVVTDACSHVTQDSSWVKVITCSKFIWINANFASFHSHLWNTIVIQLRAFSFPVLSWEIPLRLTESDVFYASGSSSSSLFWNKQIKNSIDRMKEKSETYRNWNLIKRICSGKAVTMFHISLKYFTVEIYLFIGLVFFFVVFFFPERGVQGETYL